MSQFQTLLLIATCYLLSISAVSGTNDAPLSASSVYPNSSATKSYNPQASCQLGSGRDAHRISDVSAPLWPYQIYKSSTSNPPEFETTYNGQTLAPGLILFTPSQLTAVVGTKDVAPLIMTDSGQLVWNGPTSNATNFRMATYRNQSVITYWSGLSTAGANIGHGYGNITFLDDSYSEILTLCPNFNLVIPGGDSFLCQADLHESFLTDRDTMLISAYNATPADLSSIGGPSDGWVFDSLFFEVDPQTANVLFRWSALEHVSVSQTKQPLGATGTINSPFDYFHINSVATMDDNFLVNGRHVFSTYLVGGSGDILWTLQGETGGDFGPLPADGQFAWQHHARPHNVTSTSITISYFNNYNSAVENGTHASNGLILQLPLPPNKSNPPVVIAALAQPEESIFSDSQGSHEILSNGNSLLDYGQISLLREFGPSDPAKNLTGDLRWSARFGYDNLVQSYRGFKKPWHATPSTIPDLVAEGGDGGCGIGYVSWNGATDMETWAVYEGETENELMLVGEVGYRGFETSFGVGGKYVQVDAVRGGKVIRTSQVVRSEESQ